MISAEQALEKILELAKPRVAEWVALEGALGRFSATQIHAKKAIPPFDNAAMDGFALVASQCPGRFAIQGTLAAGAAPTNRLRSGFAYRIMTGAPMPRGADCVVIRENVSDDGEHIEVAAPALPGQNVRRCGEDIGAGADILPAGTQLGASELALVASQGLQGVDVVAKPTVGIVATGDELVAVGGATNPGKIYSSNNHSLAAQVWEAGGIPIDFGIVGDDIDQVRLRVSDALGRVDVLVTSGGVSVGEFDPMHRVLDSLRLNVLFSKVAIKPGKPIAVAHGGDEVIVFALPGNPASSAVTFELFVRPYLRAQLGASKKVRPRIDAFFGGRYNKPPGRSHFLRAELEFRAGCVWAAPRPQQGSGMLSSMVGADALVVLPSDQLSIEPGDLVETIVLR